MRAHLIIRSLSVAEPLLSRWLVILTIPLFLAAPVRAQDSVATDTAASVPATDTASVPATDTVAVLSASDSLSAPTIRAIEIRRSDIFDSSETKHWYARVANALHFQTRESVVRRELLFNEGGRYDSSRVAETARNLRQLNLFRRVQIDTVSTDTGLTVRVETKDGWTTKTDARFRSTGGQTEWGLTYSEGNLFGTGTRFTARYKKSPDRSSELFQLQQPRFVAKSVRLALMYENRSDGQRFSAGVERPFYSIETPKGIGFTTAVASERVLQFLNGNQTAADTLWRRYLISRIDAATALHASPAGYLRLGVFGQIRRDDFVPIALKSSEPRSVTGAFGSYLEWRRANFVVTRGFVGLARDEDVDVSRAFQVGLSLAPKAFGYNRDGIGGFSSLRFGATFHGGFTFFDARANGVFTSAGLDSGWVQLAWTMALQPTHGQVAILHADNGWLKRPLPGSEFDLGFAVGPRGFPIHAFTGDREYFLTAEYRATIAPDLFHVLSFGLAGFGDHGGAWYRGTPRRSGSDLGLGLRLSSSRSAELDPVRIDFAYRFRNDANGKGWIVVIAKGFVFSSTMRP